MGLVADFRQCRLPGLDKVVAAGGGPLLRVGNALPLGRGRLASDTRFNCVTQDVLQREAQQRRVALDDDWVRPSGDDVLDCEIGDRDLTRDQVREIELCPLR